MRAIAQPSMFAHDVVSDFMFAKDALFAQLNLSDEEYRLYAQMHQPIAAQLREPDLVVWLQASAPSLLARVRGRGVAMEHGIDLAYLQRLCDAYAEFFASYDGAPVFVVDTERFDPLERDADLGPDDSLARAASKAGASSSRIAGGRLRLTSGPPRQGPTTRSIADRDAARARRDHAAPFRPTDRPAAAARCRSC